MTGVGGIIENIWKRESEPAEFAFEQRHHRIRCQLVSNRERDDRILSEMLWYIGGLRRLDLNSGQGAGAGKQMDACLAVVERAGDVHGGEAAAENRKRTLIADPGPQATEGVGVDDVVGGRGRGRGPHTWSDNRDVCRRQIGGVTEYRHPVDSGLYGPGVHRVEPDADPAVAETGDCLRQGRRQVVAVDGSGHRHFVEVGRRASTPVKPAAERVKRRRERLEPVLRGVHRRGRYVTTKCAAASEAFRAVDDVECQSAPGAVCKLCESTQCEGAADADSDEGDARDGRRVHRRKADRHRASLMVVWASVAMREIVVISESLRNPREARFPY